MLIHIKFVTEFDSEISSHLPMFFMKSYFLLNQTYLHFIISSGIIRKISIKMVIMMYHLLLKSIAPKISHPTIKN